jgi:hypothetical protein
MTKPGKNTVAVVLLTALALGAAFQTRGLWGGFWPGRREIKDGLQTIERLHNEHRTAQGRRDGLEADRDSFIRHAKGIWIERRDGNANTEASRRLEDAAAAAGIKLSTISRLQSAKVADGIKVMEITVNATDTYDKLVAFVDGLYRVAPRFYWKVLNIRPDKDDQVRLYGTLQFLSVDDEDLKGIVLE